MARLIQEPIPGCSAFCDHFLGLTIAEVRVIKPLLEKRLLTAQNRYDHFKDIHEIGEATEGQQTKMVNYSDEVDAIHRILEGIEDHLRFNAKDRNQ